MKEVESELSKRKLEDSDLVTLLDEKMRIWVGRQKKSDDSELVTVLDEKS